MKRQLAVLLGVLCANFSISQNETDALRYSFLNYSGTARFMGVGGSMSALGADMSSISLNPAGMGKYNRGDFSFTSNVTSTNVGATFNNDNVTRFDNRLNFNFSNIGGVFVAPISDGSQWRKVQFGYTYTRTNDFHSNIRIEGEHNNSQLDVFAASAQTSTPDNILDNSPFDAGLAYDAYLLSDDSVTGEFFPWYSTDQIKQTKSIERRGRQYASDILISGNYADKILIGGSVGFPSIRFKENSTYTETFIDDTLYDLEDFTYSNELQTNGSGFNAKLGVIFIPHPSVRIGMAVHSPTWYTMSDKYSSTISSNFTDDSYDVTDAKSPDGFFEYRLKTPARLMGSLAFVIGKRGFVSAEYEFVDYANAKLKKNNQGGDNYSFNAENDAINTNYKGASNFKVGGEFRMTNYWTVRAGYALYQSPIKSEQVDFEASRVNYSGGLGYKNRNFSLDFTYSLAKSTQDYYLYDPSITKAVKLDNSTNNFMVTAGFRF